ncbi:unnamed protein product [Rotaria sp. Silwood2]|nr:unnamed protein product [Rotaria sp. Silwood2]CAF3348214.1 unnamed protein product [Rotaria sp. Silwood2]CAF4149550.1 unnamed protein product [Rotaria sp. Silwood2]CAF4705457.1 unnamed protein product [Rotaria sp. Silwood2]
MKRANKDIDNSLLSLKHFHADVLYSFYTPEKLETRLHRLIIDYYTEIKLDKIPYDEYACIHHLLKDSNNPLQPELLILSDEYITCLTERYLTYFRKNLIQSIFVNLKRLTLINCSTSEIQQINRNYIDYLTRLEYFHINVYKFNEDLSKLILSFFD